MKYQPTPRFLRDYARLNRRERSIFLSVVREINVAYARDSTSWPPRWPTKLRVKAVRGAASIWEMTWSFAGPDGRATFELVTIDREPAILWRRIGGHEIFRDP